LKSIYVLTTDTTLKRKAHDEKGVVVATRAFFDSYFSMEVCCAKKACHFPFSQT